MTADCRAGAVAARSPPRPRRGTAPPRRRRPMPASTSRRASTRSGCGVRTTTTSARSPTRRSSSATRRSPPMSSGVLCDDRRRGPLRARPASTSCASRPSTHRCRRTARCAYYSGLLLRVRSEANSAQCWDMNSAISNAATGWQRSRRRRTGTDLLAWAAVLAQCRTAHYGMARSFDDLQLFGLWRRSSASAAIRSARPTCSASAISTHSSFPPQAACVIWHNVMAEAEASARRAGLKKPEFQHDRLLPPRTRPRRSARTISPRSPPPMARGARDGADALSRRAWRRGCPSSSTTRSSSTISAAAII